MYLVEIELNKDIQLSNVEYGEESEVENNYWEEVMMVVENNLVVKKSSNG